MVSWYLSVTYLPSYDAHILATQGGGSVQMAYAMTAKEAGKAPDGYISNLSGGGQQYHVYVHRWGWHVYGGVRWF
jgi:hypothetical protein